MKISKSLIITVIACALSTTNLTPAKAEISKKNVQPIASITKTASFNVAIVDIQKVVESSPKINALNIDRKNKFNELAAFVEKAKADVAKQTDATAKKALEDKYNKELNDRKNALDSDYAKKMSVIDLEITALIKSKAKQMNFDLVMAKNNVIDGGVDITAEIIKGLK